MRWEPITKPPPAAGHVLGPRADAVAFRCVGRHGEVTDYSHRNLRDETSRFANLLR